MVGGLGPPPPRGVNVGLGCGVGVEVGVEVGVMRRRVAVGVGVAELVAVAVALGVIVAVAVSVGVIVGVVEGVLVAVALGSTLDAAFVAVFVGVNVGVPTSPGPTAINAVAQTASKATKPAMAPNLLRLSFWRIRMSSSVDNRLVPVGSTKEACASCRAERISLALAKRFVIGTSIARRMTRSTSGEIDGLISRKVRNEPGLETRRVTVAGGSPVSK